jgi:hypothetical protein
VKKVLRNYNERKYPLFLYKIYDNLKITRNLFLNEKKIKNDNNNSPFFIIGSGRSGNTLLRAVLCNHSKISIPPESYVLPKMVRKFKSYNYLPWRELIKIIVGELESHNQYFTWELDISPVYQRLLKIDKKDRTLQTIVNEIYTYYSEEKFPGFEIWGDKTPLNTLNLGWLNQLFPNAKHIHIIRDGRDVVSSYLKMGRYDNIEDACWRWNRSIELGQKFGNDKSKENYCEVRYEDFVTNPKKEIKEICKFLDIKYEDRMTDHRENIDVLGDVNKLKHHNNLSRAINDNSIGKYKQNLNKNQIEKMIRLIKDNLIKLNYL